MKRVIFDEIRNGSMLVLPDDAGLFSDTDTETAEGKVISNYRGDKDFPTYVEPEETPPIELVITDVQGALSVSDDFSYFLAKEGAEVTFSGTLNIPNSPKPFALPIKRDDTGRVIFSLAAVTNGTFTTKVKFPTSGMWHTDAELVNSFRDPGEHIVFGGVKGVVSV